MEYIIGIDGGSTKTDFLLCDISGNVIGRRILESCNPNVVGMDKSCAVIKEGVLGLLNEYKIQDCSQVCIFAGLSGGSTGKNKEKIGSILKESFPDAAIYNDSDAINSINLGLGDDDGISVIAGTGSIVFARRKEALYRIGGWGYLFDKAGSGYDIGREAISAALCEHDKTGEKTVITKLATKKAGAEIYDILDKLYLKDRRYIASFAPIVFEAYKKGDKVAERIINETVSRLKKMIDTASKYFDSSKIKVSCTGGLFKTEIMKKLIIENDRYDFVFPSLPPVCGAVYQAYKSIGLTVPKCLYDNFLRFEKSGD